MTFDAELAELLDHVCVTVVKATSTGWEYRCCCGFQSAPSLTEAQARDYATMHERAR